MRLTDVTLRKSLLAALTVSLSGCGTDEIPSGLKRTPDGPGATVRFDLYAKPLPDIPLPNDTATWPDPTSRTGLRINASLVAPTNIERNAREKFSELEGWGTFSTISVGFDKTDPQDARPALDLGAFLARHRGDNYELNDDAVYIVNLKTGVPTFIDVGEGSYPQAVFDKNRYWRNDTRRLEPFLLFDSADETIDPRTGQFDPQRTVTGERNGLAIYDPRWDTDFDGVIDRPNLLTPDTCPHQVSVALGEVGEVDRDRCLADNLLDWYEKETDTLLLRPLIPLDESTPYAVVITDRVVDADGHPVKSPFDFVYHPSQRARVEQLQSHLQNPDLASYYGDIGGTGLEHIVFAWSFTTEPTTEDLIVVRNGLYGQGPFSYLASQFPAKMDLMRTSGTDDSEREDFVEPEPWFEQDECTGRENQFYVLDFQDPDNRIVLETLATQFGLKDSEVDELLESWTSISHAVVGQYQSPFFIQGGPSSTEPDGAWSLDYVTGDGFVTSDTVQFVLFVPLETETRKQPFDITYYGHGYTGAWVESFGFAGKMAAQGVGTFSINAVGHGLEFDQTTRGLARGIGRSFCLAPLIDALFDARYRDLDFNGDPFDNSGGDFWTSYVFHTRDVVRQTAVDVLQMFRILKGFDGEQMAEQDYDQDGQPNLAGDFDGDGRVDVGGPGRKYHAWGQSLGGFISPFAAALDPDVISAAPTSGSVGLVDVMSRTIEGGVFNGLYLRNFGPLIVGVPPEEVPENTACEPDQISLRFILVDVNDDREIELGCIDDQGFVSGGTILVNNVDNGERRCARVSGDDEQGNGSGRFRIGIPTSKGDRIELSFYDQPDVVDSYSPDHGCNVTPDANRIALIFRWGDGGVAEGESSPRDLNENVCSEPRGCTYFQGRYYAAGERLTSPAEGFGYVRQTPNLRRFTTLATTAIDPADPAGLLQYFGLKPILDPWGDPHPATGLLSIVTIGDINVPLNTGIAMGRVAGAVPFLLPDAAERYPAHADYVTPEPLYTEIGLKTPHRMILDNYVAEGLNRLRRAAPEDLAGCGRNKVAPENDARGCLPSCETGEDCESGQCVSGRCADTAVPEDTCARYLFDIDVVDEGQATYGEREAQRPLRLGRIATPAAVDNILDTWRPRLEGRPFSSDSDGWSADQKIIAQLMAYTEPTGEHGFDPADPCEAWPSGRYFTNLVARFFASGGTDLYYLSHPETHHCLARTGPGSCSFIE